MLSSSTNLSQHCQRPRLLSDSFKALSTHTLAPAVLLHPFQLVQCYCSAMHRIVRSQGDLSIAPLMEDRQRWPDIFY